MAKAIMTLTITVDIDSPISLKETAEFFDEIIVKGREQGVLKGQITWPAMDEEIS